MPMGTAPSAGLHVGSRWAAQRGEHIGLMEQRRAGERRKYLKNEDRFFRILGAFAL